MARILIVGIGNLLREDDAVGRLAARTLSDRYAGDGNFAIVDVHQLTPEMAEAVAGSDLVLFLDVSRAGEPGTLTETEIGPAPDGNSQGAHHLTPSALITIADRVYGNRPQAILLTVTGWRFGFGEGLSEEAGQGLNRLVQRADSVVTAFGHE